MSDFSGRPFVAGSLIGRRAFSVADDGTLIGPSYPVRFEAGENVAQCYASQGFRFQMRALEQSLARLTKSPVPPPIDLNPAGEPKHQIGGRDCSCGYYAYYDGSTTYESDTRVTALIEGYGVCSVGDRGFRAEKARLVALVGDPDGPRRRSLRRPFHTLLDLTSDWLDTHKAGGAVAAFSLVLAVYGVICGVAVAVSGLPWVGAPVALLVLGCAFICYADFHGIPRRYPSVSPEVKRCVIPPKQGRQGAVPFSAVAARYPDVPVYPTVEAAIAAHPLTIPEVS